MEEHVTFPVGDITLEGLLISLPPEQTPSTGVVLCHPHPLYGGDMYNNVVTALTSAYQLAGMATLQFNFRGVGKSGGSHGEGKTEIDDVTAAVDYLLSRCGVSRVVVAGYSFGSMVGLQAGAVDARVQCLIGVALPVGMRDASFLHSADKPTLLISGDRDDFAPVPKLESLIDQLPDPKQLVILPGVDHFFMGSEADAAQAAVDFVQVLSD